MNPLIQNSLSQSLTRRRLIKGIVSGGLSLSLSGLLARAAYAQGTAPQRLICFYVPDGCEPGHWHPSGSERNFTLPSMTRTLENVKSDLVFVRGLNMYSGGSTHEGGAAKVLTATGDLSIDVFVGQNYKNETPHASLHLGIASAHENGGNFISFLGKGQPITPEDNPLRAFERLFGAQGAGDRERDRQLSVLDCAMNDLGRLQGRLGTTEKQKLDLHMDSLRQVEKRVQESASGSSDSCTDPVWNTEGWAPPPNDNSYPPYQNRDDQFAAVGKLQMDLAVLALQCDLTRAVTFQWSHPVSPTSLKAFTGVDARNHDSSHFDGNSEASIETYATFKRWYMDQFAYLLNELRSVQDIDGRTLLDNTLIFVCSELGHSALHDHADMPFILGGRAGGLETGRLLDYRGSNSGQNESHAKLLVSIARAMGIPINSFGYTGHGEGPLVGLYA